MYKTETETNTETERKNGNYIKMNILYKGGGSLLTVSGDKYDKIISL